MMTQAHYQPADAQPVRGYDMTRQSFLAPGAKKPVP